MQVVGTETRVAAKEYTVYIVSVLDVKSGREHKIFRRFSDFDDLLAKLKKRGLPNLPALPKKRLFSSMSAKVMENRKIGLGSFLHQLIVRDGLVQTDPDLRSFLELDSARAAAAADAVVSVYLLDNSKKTFKVAPRVRAAALSAQLAAKLRLAPADAATFALCVRSGETDRALQPDAHPLDVLAGWGADARLVYRKAVFRPDDVAGAPRVLRSDAHRHLVYVQAVADVLAGVFPTDDDQALKLAALHW